MTSTRRRGRERGRARRRVGLDLDAVEARRGAGRRPPRRGSARGVGGLRSRQACGRRGPAGRGSRRVLVGRGSTRRRRSRAARAAARAASRRPRGCGRRRGPRPPRISSRPGRPPRRAADRLAEERLDRLRARRRSAPRPGRDARTRRRAARRSRAGPRRRASRAAIASRVSPRTSVCSSPTFVSRTTRRIDDVRRVVPAAEPRLDRRRPSTPRAAKSAKAAAVSVSNCVAPSASAAGADTLDRALEPGGVGVEPLVPARDVRRGVRGPADRARDPASGVDLPFVPTTCTASNVRCGFAEPREQLEHALRAEAVLRPGRERLEPGDVRRQPPMASSSRR